MGGLCCGYSLVVVVSTEIVLWKSLQLHRADETLTISQLQIPDFIVHGTRCNEYSIQWSFWVANLFDCGSSPRISAEDWDTGSMVRTLNY